MSSGAAALVVCRCACDLFDEMPHPAVMDPARAAVQTGVMLKPYSWLLMEDDVHSKSEMRRRWPQPQAKMIHSDRGQCWQTECLSGDNGIVSTSHHHRIRGARGAQPLRVFLARCGHLRCRPHGPTTYVLEADDVFHDISAGIVRPALATVSEPRKLRHKAKQVHHERVQLLMLCLNQFIMRAHLDNKQGKLVFLPLPRKPIVFLPFFL